MAKKLLYALALAAILFSCKKAEPAIEPWNDETRSLSERLGSLPDVKSVSEMSKDADFPKGVYRVVFNLPIDHKNPSSARFENVVYVGIKHTDSLNVFYMSGYETGEPGAHPQDVTSIFGCNQFNYAHRDFQGALTGTDYAYLGTDQAAADQKQIIDNLKLMFKRKMIITGASKGGICTALLAGYYPRMDAVYIPKVAPFCRQRDAKHGHSFNLNQVGTPAVRARLLATQRKILALKDNKTVMDDFQSKVESNITDLSTSLTDIFYYVIQDYGSIFWSNKGLADELPDEDLTGEDLWYAVAYTGSFMAAYNNFRNNTYYIQAMQELGSFGYWEDMSDIYVPTQKSYLKALLPDRFHNLTYDQGATFSKYIDQAVSTTDKPMFFLYGGQDAWTQFALEDKYVNGTNIRKYIVPGGFHGTDISDIPAADRQQVIAWLRSYLYN